VVSPQPQRSGALDEALALVEGAKAGPLDEFQRAKADVLRARLSFATDRGSEARRPFCSAQRSGLSRWTCRSRARSTSTR
jgi:hypothetical protein